MTTESIETVLKKMENLPEGVLDWHVETGSDATGEPAIWVWVILKDEALKKLDSMSREHFREQISTGIQKKIIGQYGTSIPWVYVRFRAASEVL